jgi:hypothetical protein
MEASTTFAASRAGALAPHTPRMRSLASIVCGVWLTACGAAPPPAAMPPRPCLPSSYVAQQRPFGGRGALPETAPLPRATSVLDIPVALALAAADAASAGRCAASATTQSAPTYVATTALGFDPDDGGQFHCRTVSGMTDRIVADSLERAGEICEELTAEPCVCVAE